MQCLPLPYPALNLLLTFLGQDFRVHYRLTCVKHYESSWLVLMTLQANEKKNNSKKSSLLDQSTGNHLASYLFLTSFGRGHLITCSSKNCTHYLIPSREVHLATYPCIRRLKNILLSKTITLLFARAVTLWALMGRNQLLTVDNGPSVKYYGWTNLKFSLPFLHYNSPVH